MATDPKKKASTEPKKSALTDTQQLSDALARKVAKKQITMEVAQKQQRAADKKAMTVKSIKNTTGGGTQEVAGSSFTKERKPKYKRDNHGNLKAY